MSVCCTVLYVHLFRAPAGNDRGTNNFPLWEAWRLFITIGPPLDPSILKYCSNFLFSKEYNTLCKSLHISTLNKFKQSQTFYGIFLDPFTFSQGLVKNLKMAVHTDSGLGVLPFVILAREGGQWRTKKVVSIEYT